MFAKWTEARTQELHRLCPLFADRTQEDGKQTGRGQAHIPVCSKITILFGTSGSIRQTLWRGLASRPTFGDLGCSLKLWWLRPRMSAIQTWALSSCDLSVPARLRSSST